MKSFGVVAEAFRYPAPGRLDALAASLAEMPPGPARESCAAFLGQVRPLSLGEWEELYTRTLDLNPLAVPYVGFQAWGESYLRGGFMSRLNAELVRCGVDPAGELPDHLVPVLRYLEAAPDPLPELLQILPPAVQGMLKTLKAADPGNPYLHLLEAAGRLAQGLKVQE
ncbi:MAG TPA: hypothetical protein VF498_03585 [Anaerolineales bacterium]